MAEDNPQQQQLRKEMEDKKVSEVAADDMGNIIYYAIIVIIGYVIMMVINSPTFQALAATLGQLFGAAVDVLSFLADHPWLFLLLAFAKPLFKVLSELTKRLGSLESIRQSYKIDRLFKDPAFRGRNEGFARKVRAEYNTFDDAQKTQMSETLKSMDQKFDRTAAMEKIDAEYPDASVMEKYNILSQMEVDYQRNIGTRSFGSLNGIGDPKLKKVDNLLIQGLINSAQNGLDAMRVGNPLAAVDANNILRASDVVDKVGKEIKDVYGIEEFEKIKASVKQASELLEARIKITNKIAYLNNTDSFADGKKLDVDKVLKVAQARAQAKLREMPNGMSLPEFEKNKILNTELEIMNRKELNTADPAKWTSTGPDGPINPKTGKPQSTFGMPDAFKDLAKPSGGLFGSSSTPGTFGKIPTIRPPRLRV